MGQYFTKEGLQKLKEELHYLKTTKTKEIADLLRYAASFGDLKENAGYHDAKDRQAFLLGRIEELENMINDAMVYEKKATDKIQIGSSIVIVLDGSEQMYDVVAPGESDILKNRLSYQSPLGQKLMGRGVGDQFYYEVRGNKMKVKILKIS